MKILNYPYVFIAALVLLVYGQTMHYDFVLDDASVISENFIVKKGSNAIVEIFTSPYRAGYWSTGGNLYRPLPLSVFAILWQWGDGASTIYHIVNILLYALVCMALYKVLVETIMLPKKWAMLSTVIYTVHPIHTEVVANVKSQDELWALLFGLTVIWAANKYMQRMQVKWMLLVVLSFALALFSKEGSVVFVLLMALLWWFKNGELKSTGKLFVGLGVAFTGFMWMRAHALGNQTETLATEIAVQRANVLDHYLKSGYFLGLYLVKNFLPYGLSSQYAEFFNGIPSMVKVLGALSLLVHVGLLWVAIKWVKAKNYWGVIVLGYLIAMALYSNLFVVIGTAFGERLTFVASVFSSVAIASGLMYMGEKYNKLNVVVAVLVFCFAGWSFKRTQAWESNTILYATDVEVQPQSAVLNYWRGLDLAGDAYLATQSAEGQKQALNLALEYLQKATTLKKDYGAAYAQMGLAYYKLQNNAKAIEYYEKAFATGYGGENLYNNVAAIYFGQQNFVKAQEYYELTVKQFPYHKDAWGNLGVTLAQQGKFKESLSVFQKAIEIAPSNAMLYMYMGMSYNALGDATTAQPYFEKAFALNPSLRK